MRDKRSKSPPTPTYAVTDVSRKELGQLTVPNKGVHQSRLDAAGRSPGQQQAAQKQMHSLTQKGMAFVQQQKQVSATRTTPSQTTAPPAKQAAAVKTEEQNRVQAMFSKAATYTRELAAKGRNALDRGSGQRDNNRSTAQERSQQQTKEKERGR